MLHQRPTAKSRHKFLLKVKGELHRLMHVGVLAQQRYLTQALRGFYGYFGYPGCSPALETIRDQVFYAWYQVLRGAANEAIGPKVGTLANGGSGFPE